MQHRGRGAARDEHALRVDRHAGPALLVRGDRLAQRAQAAAVGVVGLALGEGARARPPRRRAAAARRARRARGAASSRRAPRARRRAPSPPSRGTAGARGCVRPGGGTRRARVANRRFRCQARTLAQTPGSSIVSIPADGDARRSLACTPRIQELGGPVGKGAQILGGATLVALLLGWLAVRGRRGRRLPLLQDARRVPERVGERRRRFARARLRRDGLDRARRARQGDPLPRAGGRPARGRHRRQGDGGELREPRGARPLQGRRRGRGRGQAPTDGRFVATNVLAKCPSKFEAAEKERAANAPPAT